jgi:hypothetical protein
MHIGTIVGQFTTSSQVLLQYLVLGQSLGARQDISKIPMYNGTDDISTQSLGRRNSRSYPDHGNGLDHSRKQWTTLGTEAFGSFKHQVICLVIVSR